jgi:hypothetical protein
MRLIRSDKRIYSAENRPNLPIKKDGGKNQDFFGSSSRYSELKKKNENLESLKHFNYKLEREISLRKSYEKMNNEKDGKCKEIDLNNNNESGNNNDNDNNNNNDMNNIKSGDNDSDVNGMNSDMNSDNNNDNINNNKDNNNNDNNNNINNNLNTNINININTNINTHINTNINTNTNTNTNTNNHTNNHTNNTTNVMKIPEFNDTKIPLSLVTMRIRNNGGKELILRSILSIKNNTARVFQLSVRKRSDVTDTSLGKQNIVLTTAFLSLFTSLVFFSFFIVFFFFCFSVLFVLSFFFAS